MGTVDDGEAVGLDCDG
jgi:hypothetical protein